MSLWEYIYTPFKFPKGHKIRLFEAFSGIGCQAMALKRITQDYELIGFSEIDKYAIQSYRAIHGEVKNYGDITKMTEIPSCDIFTYSFPCTDLSKAGKQKGLNNTRSGLVYEVLRLLKATSDKPKVLIMENVVDLVQVNFVAQFNEIQLELERMGYRNYNEVLNAKDYGIPQNRERVFMVSILGDYSYEFPEKIKLKLRLKDILENNKKLGYYLSEKAINGFVKSTLEAKASGNGFKFEPTSGDSLAHAVLIKPGQRKDDNFIKEPIIAESYYLDQKHLENIKAWKSYQNPLDNPLGDNSICPTITTRVAETDAGGISASMILLKQVAYLDGFESQGRIYDENGLSPTIQTLQGGNRQPKIAIKIEQFIEEAKKQYPNRGIWIDEIGIPHWIRKLTERECWRLMGISDSDFDKAQASGVSKSQLYKQAGNGICVPVFEAILRGLIE